MKRLLFLSALAGILCSTPSWLRAKPSHTRSPVPQHHVVLVHGIFDRGRDFRKMKGALHAAGFHVHAIDLKPNSGRKGLAHLAEQLKRYIEKNIPAQSKTSILSFSMGGLVSRYYLQRLGGIGRIHRFISIATPHHGTKTGKLLPIRSCREMRPDSEFLQDLNQDIKTLDPLQPLSLWTKYDLIIQPQKSSILGVGKDLHIPNPLHPGMIRDKRAIEACLEHLQH